jgi:hypothetical protein
MLHYLYSLKIKEYVVTLEPKCGVDLLICDLEAVKHINTGRFRPNGKLGIMERVTESSLTPLCLQLECAIAESYYRSHSVTSGPVSESS